LFFVGSCFHFSRGAVGLLWLFPLGTRARKRDARGGRAGNRAGGRDSAPPEKGKRGVGGSGLEKSHCGRPEELWGWSGQALVLVARGGGWRHAGGEHRHRDGRAAARVLAGRAFGRWAIPLRSNPSCVPITRALRHRFFARESRTGRTRARVRRARPGHAERSAPAAADALNPRLDSRLSGPPAV